MMPDPVIARRKPYLVEVEAGKTYHWCACGRSKKQPFCDGSHQGTDFRPVSWKADESGDKLFCACKHTRSQPFCDGAHNGLSEKYAEATAGDGATARLVDYETADGGAQKALLDNSCYVIRVPEAAMETVGALKIFPVIGTRDGARHLSQYLGILAAGQSPVLVYPGSDVALFVRSGQGQVLITDRSFPIEPETGVSIKPGEGFRLVNDGTQPIVLNITVCPPCAEPEYRDDMPATFDASVPVRQQGVDEAKREPMADRFFQVLLDQRQQQTPVTQFIGEVPRSRAAHHRHLYEETITVLAGEGFMWTDETRAPVRPGDTIFLPLKQHHSLECTTEGGMRLVGVTFPSMSPAINY